MAAAGGTEVELEGRKEGIKLGLKPGREEWGLDSKRTLVVKTVLRPTEAKKTAKKKSSVIHPCTVFNAF